MIKVIRISIIIFFAFIYTTFAQESSAYSRYGVGDIVYGYSAKMLGIGDLGVTQLDPDHIITTNPASWSVFDRTRIEISMGYKGVAISNATESVFTSETKLRGITLGFPLSTTHGAGLVLGLLPYSEVSYLSEQDFPSTDEDIPAYKIKYEGDGGIAKFLIGSSYTLPSGISLGATFEYYFGNMKYISDLEFDENSNNVNTNYEDNYRLRGIGTTVGIISQNLAKALDISSFSDLRVGLSFNYLSKLNTDTLYSATSLSVVDTLGYSTSLKTYIPYRLNAGISLALSEIHKFNLDFMYQPWNEYDFNNVQSENLRNALKVSFSYEYKPTKGTGLAAVELMAWRGGLSYEETPYKFNGVNINQYSVFGGFTFPFGGENTVDLTVQYGIRGTIENNLLKENFVKLYLGVSFGELWFLRYEK